MKRRLLLIVDSMPYVKSNCYLGQLFETLGSNYTVKVISLRQLRLGLGYVRRPHAFDAVLSIVRQRTLAQNIGLLRDYLGDTPIFVYDQDPWQAFMDDSPQRGNYTIIAGALNIKSFLNTSRWWCDFIQKSGFPSIFVRMGMLPNFCEIGPPWEQRVVSIGFQGTVHPYRKMFFDQLANLGVRVETMPSVPYERFLAALHEIQIYIHSTQYAPWFTDGVRTVHAMWIKETEAASRGCFCIRDYDDEAAAYDIAELPTIFTFRNVAEVPEIVDRIQSMPSAERSERMRTSVERMRQRNDWMTVVDAIEGRRT